MEYFEGVLFGIGISLIVWVWIEDINLRDK
jgi:hypothetical protein